MYAQNLQDHNPDEQTFQRVVSLDYAKARAVVSISSRADGETTPTLQQLMISSDLEPTFLEIGAKFAATKRRELSHDALFRLYSPGSKPERSEIEVLDAGTQQLISPHLTALQEGADPFQGSKRMLESLRYYVVAVYPLEDPANPVYFFRRCTTKGRLGSKKLGLVYYSTHQYNTLTDSLFWFDRQVDCVYVADTMFVFNKYNFHEMFGLYELLKDLAAKTLDEIGHRITIVGLDQFKQDCLNDRAKVMKLRSISANAYRNRVTFRDIETINRVQRLGLTLGQNRIVYSPRSCWRLLRLFDNDYLWSLITREAYESHGKLPV